jgi:hypothetical protein
LKGAEVCVLDFLDNERFLPVRVITVRMAATIFTFELGEWEGVEIPESELEIFLAPPVELGEWRSSTPTHSWRLLEPTGTYKRARDAIESLLVRSIDAGRLSTLVERRDLTGGLVSSETLLDVDKARDWAESHGLGTADVFADYVDAEDEIAMSALSRINDERERLENPEERERVKRRAAAMDSDHVVELIRENARLRDQSSVRERQDLPLDTRQRTTLLAIIGALAEAAHIDLTKPHKAGEAIESMLVDKGVKVSARTIGENLKAVREAMDRRKS